jgi:3-hydroxyacyl-CoA dehydrogenase/enoyl-CoA hydratase/3-hydroxybutyryl-CoA epimerase
VLQDIDQHPGGLPGFVDRARELAVRYGDRFVPLVRLLAKAREGANFV